MPVAPDHHAAPLDDAALRNLADTAFEGLASIVLAVSGGPDSMALLPLANVWAADRAGRGEPVPPIVVATVDHRLRATSAAEAAAVGRTATALGLPHHTLLWSEPKPATGLQAAARVARYRALVARAVEAELPCPVGIVVAHHLDDQAETLLMRLARGSGLDGLSAMATRRPVPASWRPGSSRAASAGDVLIVRPFLDIPKARLCATLAARGIEWSDDPSNMNDDFERVRVRRALAAEPGLSPRALAATARRLGRARAALERLTADLAAAIVNTHDGAYVAIDAVGFDRAPAELQVRLMQLALAHAGERDRDPPRLVAVEALTEQIAAGPDAFSTLAGAAIVRQGPWITVTREPGRHGLPVLALAAGASSVWDGRFRVSADRDCVVRALSATELTSLRTTDHDRAPGLTALPRTAQLTLPAFFDPHGGLIAIPQTGLVRAAGLFTSCFIPGC